MTAIYGWLSLQRLRRSVLWAVLAGVLLTAQFALAVHQLDHHLHPDIASVADDCVACQFSSHLSDGPSGDALPEPIGIDLGGIEPASSHLPQKPYARSGFLSRAPPYSVSV